MYTDAIVEWQMDTIGEQVKISAKGATKNLTPLKHSTVIHMAIVLLITFASCNNKHTGTHHSYDTCTVTCEQAMQEEGEYWIDICDTQKNQ